MPGPTFLDLAASIDRVLHRNTQSPDQTFATGTFAVTPLMHTLLANAGGGVVTFNLPTAVGLSGMRFTFKKVDSTANGMTINPVGGQTIDGAPSVTASQPNEVYEIESDNANWKVITHDTGGSTPGVSNLDIKSIIKIDNDFSTLDPVPGTTISFVTTRDGTSFFSCSAYTSGFSADGYSGSIGINVDGTPYTLFVDAQNNGAGGDFTSDMGYAGSIGVPLLAGAHTAFVFVTQSVIGFQATANNPLTLSVIFPSLSGPTATAAPITSQEVLANGGGTFIPNNVAFQPFGPVLTLPVFGASQTVIFSAFGSSVQEAGNLITDVQLGIRIDGVDYPGTISEINTAAASSLQSGMTAEKAIALTAGVTHTAQLVARNVAGAAATGGVSTTATIPARLGAVYTVPASLVTSSGFSAALEAVYTAANQTVSSAAFVDVTGTDVIFTLATTTIIRIDGQLTATIENPALDASSEPTFGILVNGVDYPLGQAIIINVTGFLPANRICFHKYVTLPPGVYTAKLRMRRGGAKNVVILSNAATPTICTVAYPPPSVGGNVSSSLVAVTGVTVNAFTLLTDIASSVGVDGFGTIKNTGANSLDVQETGTDFFGTTDTLITTPVLPGNFLVLSARNVITTAVPPYSDYKIEVRSTVPGSPTNFSLNFLIEAAP